MSRGEYHITLTENDLEDIIEFMATFEDEYIGTSYYENGKARYKELIDKLEQAKQKPYTNFQRIKDEMTIDAIVNDYLFDTRDINHYINDNYNCKENKVMPLRKWLESEVKE